jgi:4-amino-4-deoxy-L-arabinose transferase-like glycosyltransferase
MMRWPFALTLVGFALRLHNLGASSFRGDEAFTIINWVRPPLLQTLTGDIVTRDPQPPLAYALFHTWGRTFGESEVAMRLLPALLGTLGIPALYALGHRIGGRRAGILAALLWAFHPLQIWHAQDARNYALWATWSVLALWLALRALDKQRRLDWLLYGVTAVAAAYVYYLELFTLLVINVFVLIDLLVIRRVWRLYARWLGVQVAIGLLLAPWFLQERLLTGSGYGGTRGGAVDPSQLLTHFLPSLTFGTTLAPDVTSLVWPMLVVGLLVGVWLLRRNRHVVLLTLLATVPLLLLVLVSLRLDVYVPRYVLSAAPAYVLIFATAISRLTVHRASRWLTPFLIGAWLLVDAYSLHNYFYGDQYAKAADWRGVSAYLHQHVSANDWVIQAAADEALTFYYADVDRLPANPTQDAAEITATLENRRDTHTSLWLVGRTFPDWPSKDVVPTWLSENMQLVRETAVSGIPVWQYRTWAVRSDEIDPVPLGRFAEVAELASVSIQAPDPTGEVVIWGYWRALDRSEKPLKVFVHLVDGINTLWAQDDQFPQDARVGTHTWSVGELYRDVYTLDVRDLPPGEYTVLIGLYEPVRGERVLVGDNDALAVGAINLP